MKRVACRQDPAREMRAPDMNRRAASESAMNRRVMSDLGRESSGRDVAKRQHGR
jgi:hypothetical protein